MFPESLDKHICVLGHPYFHLYLVKGQRASALVEIGISATADAVIAQTASLGVMPDFLVVTHPHGDHICGLEALKKAFPGAAVVAGLGAAEFLSHSQTAESLIQEDCFMSSFINRQGFVVNRPAIHCSPSLSGCMFVEGGDELDLGSVNVRFIVAKGHAPGNILAYIPESKALFASDSLGYWFQEWSFFPIFFTGYSDYMETIDKMEVLKPKILGLAHHGIIRGADIERLFGEARKAARDVMSRIVNDIREDETIAQDLMKDYYRDRLLIYTRENILACCRLLVRRAREYATQMRPHT